MTPVVHRTDSPEATEALAARLAPALAAGDLLLLVGPLGAGKTRFAAGLARGLGCRGRVRSPSFTLVNEYASGRVPLFHLDLYRLEGPEAFALGLDEMAERGIRVVEWGDRLPPAERAEALELEFTVAGEQVRSITARAGTGRGLELLAAWNALAAGASQ